MRLGAIDIGSNAARLLITDVTTDRNNIPMFNKANLVRVPLRLGFDVFEFGRISEYRISMIMDTMRAYKSLLNVYEVEHVKACATSAMRDAVNSQEIIEKVKNETGIEIEVISGDTEANYIYENHIAENMDKENSYLYIDVGGGSTELTFFNNTKLVFKESFNIGTIRILQNRVSEDDWDHMKNVLRDDIKGLTNIMAIGSGGNINKIFSMSKRKDGKALSIDLLKDYHKELANVSLEDRINIYKLREDRADVIVPALQIYINVMRWAGIDDIYVPKIGLADGLIQHLYHELINKTS